MREWIVTGAVWVWLAIVLAVWGFTTSLLVGLSMLAVALLALWEAGRNIEKRRGDTPGNPS